MARSDLPAASAYYSESIALAQALGDTTFLGAGLAAIGTIAADLGQSEQAARLLGAAEAMSQVAGAGPSSPPAVRIAGPSTYLRGAGRGSVHRGVGTGPAALAGAGNGRGDANGRIVAPGANLSRDSASHTPT